MRLSKSAARVAQTTARTVTIPETSPDDFRARAAAADVALGPGSTGRIEIYGKRVLGICAVPLGPLMAAPWVGQRWANALAPAGVVVTDRGGVNGSWSDCDAFVEFAVPARLGQTARMRYVIALAVVAVAIIGVLVALGWALRGVSGTFRAIGEAVDDIGSGIGKATPAILGVAAAVVAVLLLGNSQSGKRGKT